MSSRTPIPAIRLRTAFWLAGALISLAYFGLRGGTDRDGGLSVRESRLFSVGDTPVTLRERPSGGRWIVVAGPEDPTLHRNRGPFGSFWRTLTWAGWSRRAERPFLPEGTWLLEGRTLRRVWKQPASNWPQDDYLCSGGGDSSAQLLELSTGRSYTRARAMEAFGLDPDVPEGRTTGSVMPYVSDDEDFRNIVRSPGTPTFTAPGIDDWLPDRSAGNQWCQVGNAKILLCTLRNDRVLPPGLYAVSDEYASRRLRLSEGGEPLAVSHDGKTVFLRRDHAVWRLDLPATLPALLDRQQVPPLPDPPVESLP